MKTLFSLLLTLTFGIVYSQKKNKTKDNAVVWVKLTCEKGVSDAKIDAKKGIYKCLTYGLVFERNPELSNFIRDYRKKKYGIIVGNGGCVTSDYSECYSKEIEKIIKKKFGEDIFERSRKEAEELYFKK